MDPNANNYDAAATCVAECTYNWSCVGDGFVTDTCSSKSDLGVSITPGTSQDDVYLTQIADSTNGLQGTDVNTLKFQYLNVSGSCSTPIAGASWWTTPTITLNNMSLGYTTNIPTWVHVISLLNNFGLVVDLTMSFADVKVLLIPSGWDLALGFAACACDYGYCECTEMTDGTGTYATQELCLINPTDCCGTPPTTGCTDPTASNYNSEATVDDGSCTFPGCTDPLATNFDVAANLDDGSCTYMWSCTPASVASDDCSAKQDFATQFANITLVAEYFADPANGLQASDASTYKFELLGAPVRESSCLSTGGEVYHFLHEFTVELNGSPVFASSNWAAVIAYLVSIGYVVDLTMTRAAVIIVMNGTPSLAHTLSEDSTPCTCTYTECECVQDPAGTFATEAACQADVGNCCDD